jgi:translation initiation factor IF-3
LTRGGSPCYYAARAKDGCFGHPFLYSRRKINISKPPIARINHAIRAPEVRLIDQNGEMLGVKPIREALMMAENTGYDLIEIAPDAVPPVCKLGSLSKFLYEKEKKRKEARKSKAAGQVKEIRMRPKIGEHDFNFKVNNIVKFLKERNKVRVSFVFFGREMEHKEVAHKMLDRIQQMIAGVGTIESKPQMYGNRLISILVPGK